MNKKREILKELSNLSLEDKQILLNNLQQRIEAGDNSPAILEKYLYISEKIEKEKQNTEVKYKGVILGETYTFEITDKHTGIKNIKNSWWKEEFGHLNYKFKNYNETTIEEIEQNKFDKYLPQNHTSQDKLYPVIVIKLYSEDLLLEDKKITYILNTYFTNNNVAWIYNNYLDVLALCLKKDIN